MLRFVSESEADVLRVASRHAGGRVPGLGPGTRRAPDLREAQETGRGEGLRRVELGARMIVFRCPMTVTAALERETARSEENTYHYGVMRRAIDLIDSGGGDL
ncbi:MAG: hypothetical protein HRT62_19035, partial [Epibacterium sp.]|nr:hypothetical protein [Epibacterium sp.]